MPEPYKTEFPAPLTPSAASRRQAFYAQWITISIFWILIAMAFLLEVSWYDPNGVTYNWRPVAIQWLPWIILTPAVMWLTSAFTIERSNWFRNIWIHLAACIVIVGGLGSLSYLDARRSAMEFFRFPADRPGDGGNGFPMGGSNYFFGATNFGPPEGQRGFRPGGGPFQPGPMSPQNSSEPGREQYPRWAGGWDTNWRGPRPEGGLPPGGPRFWGTNMPMNFPGAGVFRAPFSMPPTALVILRNATYQLPTFWAVLGLAHALLFYGRSRDRERRGLELESRLNQARLQALRMQINPHFLFNTLNSISSLVYDQPKVADEMIGSLSDLLRVTLNTSHRQEVALREELEFLDQYLFIEQTRFGDRLTVTKEIDPTVLDAAVPNLILQPLVENAFKHGIEARLGPGAITVSAKRDGERLRLEVSDSGRGSPAGSPPRLIEGVGLSNTRARLRGLYGDRATVVFGPRPEGGFQVVMQLPLRLGLETAPLGGNANS
jgi:two-component sensor histidine kinase